MYAVDGGMKVTADTAWGLKDITGLVNNDGQEHNYGWEIDLVTKKVDYYFDGTLVAPDREARFTASGDEHHFGDATGGETHRDIWNRFIIKEAPFAMVPEPATLVLVGCGSLLLLLPRRRA